MISLLRTLFPQDDQSGSWHYWLVTQIGHMWLGMALAGATSLLAFHIWGEFPIKWQAWAVCALIYVWSEAVRGWAGWDSWEDTIFAAVYGSGGAFLAFSEQEVGSPALSSNIFMMSGIMLVAGTHLILGAKRVASNNG